ncbi:MAG: hypothetical protein LH632_02640 [Rhodoferax sp.]|nr:hypothetical protein [Rhodoferax sp.]
MRNDAQYAQRAARISALMRDLSELQAQTIVSANIGCIIHLQSGTDVPVRNWVEVLDDMLLI